MSKIQMRFVCIGRNHQIGQFARDPDADGKPQLPELKPIVSASLVPDTKTGAEDVNLPIWYGDVSGNFDIKFASEAAMAMFEPSKKYLITIEPVEEPTVQ